MHLSANGEERRYRIWPLAVAIALYVAMLAVVAWIGYHRTAGHLTYALDDAYIHMAMAKNLAQHGVLGATRFEFTSASSSPLWTLLLAGVFKLTGVHDATPLALDMLIGLATLVVTDLLLKALRVRDSLRVVGLLWIVFAAPMAPIVFGGMEHPLQIMLDVAFVGLASLLLERDDVGWDGWVAALVVLAALVGSVRYEGIALAGIVAVLFAVRRRWLQGASVLVAGVAPVIVYGLVSVSQGAFFLPNSVYVKASTSAGIGMLLHQPARYLQLMSDRLPTAYPLYPLLLACVFFAIAQRLKRRSWFDARFIFPVIAITVSVVHLSFGDVGWFFRYEDYLVVVLGLGLLLQVADVMFERPASTAQWVTVSLACLLAFGAVVACAKRGDVGLRSTPWAVKNVYDQMYQTAHFLKANPQYDTAAIGDLGAVSYYSDSLHVVDLEGLALRGVPLSELGREHMTADRIDALTRQRKAKIAVVFPGYFDLPSSWRPVRSWTIQNNLVAYGPTVTFYAIPPTTAADVANALRAYEASSLPKDVLRTAPVTTPPQP